MRRTRGTDRWWALVGVAVVAVVLPRRERTQAARGNGYAVAPIASGR